MNTMCSVEDVELWESSKDPIRNKHTHSLSLKIYDMDNRKRGEFFEFYTAEKMREISEIEISELYLSSEYHNGKASIPDVVITTTGNPNVPIFLEVKSIREKIRGNYEITRLGLDGYKYLIIHLVCPRRGLLTYSVLREHLTVLGAKYVHYWGKYSLKIPSIEWLEGWDCVYNDYDCIIQNEGMSAGAFPKNDEPLSFISKVYG